MDEKKYRLKYKMDFEPGEFTKEDVEDGEYGLTDAILLALIITSGDRAHDGTLSVAIVSMDGRTSKPGAPVPQPPTEMFQVWSMFGHQLMTKYSTQLPQWQIDILKDAFEKTRKRIVGS